jgi:hypothetical protein
MNAWHALLAHLNHQILLQVVKETVQPAQLVLIRGVTPVVVLIAPLEHILGNVRLPVPTVLQAHIRAAEHPRVLTARQGHISKTKDNLSVQIVLLAHISLEPGRQDHRLV